MASGNYMFMIVAEGDTPIYEAEFINTQRERVRPPIPCLAPPARSR